ncbi:hypothetical protein FB451DRAFT_1367550 [Mycena latifolia]|nr:hypothetical protein FB451DRAFT_1367550 [Mycena latifolia]
MPSLRWPLLSGPLCVLIAANLWGHYYVVTVPPGFADEPPRAAGTGVPARATPTRCPSLFASVLLTICVCICFFAVTRGTQMLMFQGADIQEMLSNPAEMSGVNPPSGCCHNERLSTRAWNTQSSLRGPVTVNGWDESEIHSNEGKDSIPAPMELAATDTPFKDLLHTNTVPSDTECQRIHELLVGPRKEVDKISDEIDHLQSLINELAGKRAHLTEFIDAHLALVSPARRLPEDVVAEIFTAALPSDRNAVMSGAESPLLLCHVCRAWRRLALSTPRLWATLHIVAPGTPSELLEIDERINTWLSRSGSLPLSISVVPSRTAGLNFDLDISKLLGTLIHFSSRWNHLHLSLTSQPSFEPLATLAVKDVPMLRSLVLDSFSSWDSPTAIGSDTMSFMSTNLLRLSLRQPYFLDFPVRWNKLRHLSIGYNADTRRGTSPPPAAGVLAILRQCPDLETCTAAIRREVPNPVEAPCHMEQLRQLCVLDWNSVPEFFRALVLPNLRSLEYSILAAHRGGDSPAFTPLLTSTSHIERLSLSIPAAPMSVFADILRLTPLVQELSLQWEPLATPPDFNDDLVTLLTPSTSDPHKTLCPQLRVLNLVDFFSPTDQRLLELIRARTGIHPQQVVNLASIRAISSRPMQVDIIPMLQTPIRDGLKVSLRYAPPLPLYSPSESRPADDADWVPISSQWGEQFSVD